MQREQLHESNGEGAREMSRLLLTVKEAAETLGIGRSKFYELLKRGELDSVYIDGSRRVPTSALEEYVARLLEEAA